MAWGVFNKIATGVKKAYEFTRDTALPIARKVIDVVKPLVKGTKFSGAVEAAEDAVDWGEKNLKAVHTPPRRSTAGYKPDMTSRYKRASQLEPEFTIDDEDDEE